MFRFFIAVVAFCIPTSVGAADVVDASRLSHNVEVLASDEFEGRGPATEGERKSVAFIIDSFQSAGLQAGAVGKWTQNVEALRFAIVGPVTSSAHLGNASQVFTQRDDIVLFTRTAGERVSVENAPMMFVGFGITAPERNWDDLANVDLSGKVAVVLLNEPDFGETSGPFDGDALTYYGLAGTKAKNLAAHGAIGILFVHDPELAGWQWPTAQESFTQPQFNIASKQGEASFEGWLRADTAAKLIAMDGHDLKSLAAKAREPGFRPIPLRTTFSTAFSYRTNAVQTPNVIGLLKGAGHPDEYVIYTAHWDHLGRRDDGKQERNIIYSGAVDNATGVSALIEMARAMAAGPPLDRSVLFVATTLEEKGLLGSRYYVQHPVYPLERTVAVLNIDALMPFGLAHDMTIVGPGKSDLDALFAREAGRQGRVLSPDPAPGVGAYFRADHFPFAEAGVPAAFLSSGGDLLEGGKPAGDRMSEEYVSHRYHQPADKWSPTMDFRGIKQDVEVFLRVGLDLASSREWPNWTSQSEFRNKREQSAAMRQN